MGQPSDPPADVRGHVVRRGRRQPRPGFVPQSIDLGPTVWAQRHRWITRLLGVHAVGVFVFVVIVTRSPVTWRCPETSPIVTLAVAASTVRLGRAARSVMGPRWASWSRLPCSCTCRAA